MADIVVLLHFLFVVFVVIGGLLVAWKRWIVWLHLPMLAWAVAIEMSGRVCPLTPLENWLRAKDGGATYSGGFIEHYIYPVLYPADLTRELQIYLGMVLLMINCGIYGWLLLRRHRAGQKTD